MNSSTLAWTSTAFTVGTGITYAFIFLLLVRRKTRTDFPFFFAYCALAAGSALALPLIAALIGTSSSRYFYIFWVPNLLLMFLEFGIMYEVFASLLKPYPGLLDLGRMLFRWAGLFLLVVAAIAAFATAGSGMIKCIAAVALIIERNLRLIQCGLLLLFFLFEKRLALSWRGYPISLALGLGISAAIGLSFTFIRLNISAWIPILDLTEAFSNFGIVLCWAFCFARTQPVQTVLDSPSKLIFQRWNEAILSTQFAEDKNPALATVDSFLPGIEKTVDRVLARKIAN